MGKYKQTHQGAQRAQRSVSICLRGDLVSAWEEADRELRRAQKAQLLTDSKEGAGLGDLPEKVRALEAQMQEHAEEWVLQAMARYKFRDLVAAHPPRKDENGDVIDTDRLGLNRDTFFPALIRSSVITPKIEDDDWTWLFGHTDDERADLLATGREDEIEEGVLTDRQFGNLEDAAWFLNRGEVDVPFSLAASLANQDSTGE